MSEVKKHTVLKVKDLTIGYFSKRKHVRIASSINLESNKGEFICLIGKNGIGKSTLLRTLSKVQPKLKGTIAIEGKKLESLSDNELAKKISLVLTERIPAGNLTVYELIALGRQPYTNWLGTLTNQDQEKISQAIEQTNIDSLSSKKYDELSDGQRQKVMIARALAQDTDIIFLDEPTAHLDLHHKIEVFNLLRQLAEGLHKTIIMSTHEIQLALQTCDSLWIMKEDIFITGLTSELILDARLHNLFDSPLVKFDSKTRQFIINT